MEYENDKQVIFVKDLFFAVLYCWKSILIAAVIGALLLGGFQFLQNKDNSSVNVQEFSPQQLQLQQRIDSKEAAVLNQKTYLQESPLMNMDPYSVYKTSLSFYIHNNYQIQPGMLYQNPDNTPALLNAYLQLLSDATLTKNIAEAVGMNALYVSELFSAATSENSIPGVLTVVITFNDQAKLNQIADQIKTHLTDAAESLQGQLGEHTIRCTETASGLSTDSNLANLQRQALDQLDVLSADLEKLENQYNALTPKKTSRSSMLMAVIGGFLGASAIAAVAFFGHLCSTKVYSTRTLVNQTGVKLITAIDSPAKQNLIDRWLKKLEGRTQGDWDSQVALLIAYIKNHCSNQDILLVTGDCPAGQITPVTQALQDAGLQIVAPGSLLRDPQAMTALPDCTAVLFVEQCKRSSYRNIEQQMAIVRELDKPLLGCVLLER